MARSSLEQGQSAGKASRPNMPKGYGLLDADGGSGLIPWAWVDEQAHKSRNYWIGTTLPDGRPHIMPVWGVWLNGMLYFGTDRLSRKARNIAANPEIVAHLESGDEAVVIEGVAEEVTNVSTLELYADAYDVKYKFRPDTSGAGSLTYVLRPHVAFAWKETDFPGGATRWRFHDD